MKSIRKWPVAALTLVALAFSSGTVAGQEGKRPAGSGRNIVETAVAAGSFNTLATALKAGGLVEALKGEGPFTVFAPTDEAFAKLPAGSLARLLKEENSSQLVSILTYHVAAGKLEAKQVVEMDAAATLNGQRVDIRTGEGKVLIDNASVVQTDIQCSNGVIHVIDAVLMPTSESIPAVAEKAGSFQTLLAAARAAGLVEALSSDQPLTIFAPTDKAFAALPAGTVESLLREENREKLASILKFHVVPGRVFSAEVLERAEIRTLEGGVLAAAVKDGKASVNGAEILAADIDAANGVIHVIGAVMLPPARTETDGAGRHLPTSQKSPTCPSAGGAVSIPAPTGCRK